MPASHFRKLARAVVLLLLVTAGCVDLPTGVAVEENARLIVQADLGGTAATALVVEVSAPDIPIPLIFNLPVENRVAVGTITLPAGLDRLVTARAFDRQGGETHRGTRTVRVKNGVNEAVGLTLHPLQGDQPIEVTVGHFSITLDQEAATLETGRTLQLTATVRDAEGIRVADAAVQWASLDLAVVTVSPTGVVSAHTAGETGIVAVFGGAGAAVRITVVQPPASQ